MKYIISFTTSKVLFLIIYICLSSSPGTSLPSVPPPEASCLRTSCTPECLGLYFLFPHYISCQHVVCVNFFVTLIAELFHLPEPHFLSGGLEPELCRRLLWLRYKRARSCLYRSEDQNSIFWDFYFWSKLLSLVKPAVYPPCWKTSSHKTLSLRSPEYSK